MSNYTDEVVAKMVAAYEAVADKDYEARSAVVKSLADEAKTSIASVRGVLVKAGVYKAKEGEAKASKQVSKEELVKAFEAVTGKDLKGLNGATRKSLQDLWDYIVLASDSREVA